MSDTGTVFLCLPVIFKVTILGSSSAIPSRERFPTAQVLNIHDRLFLVDCAEGTQMQLRRYRIPLQRIQYIFISHLHSDHFLGLPGLLSTMSLLGRSKDLHIFCPKGLDDFINAHNKVSGQEFRFKLHYHFLEDGVRRLLELDRLEIDSMPVSHSVPCWAFRFREKPGKPNVRKEAIDEYNLTTLEIVSLKSGKKFEGHEMRDLPVDKIVVPPAPIRTYGFITDTEYLEHLAPEFEGADLVYHESTFAEDMAHRAAETKHSTASQAGLFAARCHARKLIIGHFSVRYKDLHPLLNEARQEFPETYLAEDGRTFEIPQQNPIA